MMKNVQDLKELEPVITRMTGQHSKCYATATAHSCVALFTETHKLTIYCSNLLINEDQITRYQEYSPMPN